MKKDRFLWSAHRITERQKAGKARSIKGKQLKNSRKTDWMWMNFSTNSCCVPLKLQSTTGDIILR